MVRAATFATSLSIALWIGALSALALTGCSAASGSEPVGASASAVQYGIDGKIADEDGKIADEDGKIADEDGKIADEDGKIADEDGKIADEDGKIADEDGKIADEDGKIADTDTRIARGSCVGCSKK
jgi:peptidoglycan hydrolase CwlO-like protein